MKIFRQKKQPVGCSFLLRTDQSIESMRGNWRMLGGRQTMITYGPKVLLQMPMYKAVAWKDMQEVMRRIKL